MADQYVNKTGLQYFFNRIKTLFASQTEVTALSDKVDDIISEGGEPNKIDSIKVNGTEQTIANKTVDITAATITYQDESQPGQYQQQEVYVADKTNFVHLTGFIDESGEGVYETLTVEMPGAMTIILPNETYVDNKIIEAIPTDVSAFQNDANYQTDTQVQELIDASLEGITGIDFQVVDELPTTGAHGVIYLVHKGGAADDIYDEYIWVTPSGGTAHYEQIGTTQVDLSEYWAKEDLTALTTAEIDEILGA